MQTLTRTQPQIGDVLSMLFSGYVKTNGPVGCLGELLKQAALTHCHPTFADIGEACQTDLVLRYKCDVTRLVILGAADGLLAVGFEADCIKRPRGDPVDVLFPWSNSVADIQPLSNLAGWIQEMLTLEKWETSRWQNVVDGLSQLADRPPKRSVSLLWQQVCAANIRLAVRAANQ